MAEQKNEHWIRKNLLGGLIYVLSLVIAVSVFLAVFTRHGQNIRVPDFYGGSVAAAESVASSYGLRVEVVDSVYVRNLGRGDVFSQNPPAGAAVKKDRKISLTINALQPKTLPMPDLVGYSMRQAKAVLSSKGLRLGRLIYVKDMATNNVLRQLRAGVDVEPETVIESGTYIDLVVGLNNMDGVTNVPDVVGMKYRRSLDALQDNYLNVRNVVFDKTVATYADSLAAVVYRQRPTSEELNVTMGSEVTIYLTLDESRIPPKTLPEPAK